MTTTTKIIRKNIISKFDLNPNANPSKNYEILHTILEDVKETHMLHKTIKFNKRKHKQSKWITFGIIKSISYGDDRHTYKKLKMTDLESAQYVGLKNYLGVYNNILRKCIQLQ